MNLALREVYQVQASNARGKVHVCLSKGSLKTLTLTLRWAANEGVRFLGDERWQVERLGGTANDLVSFIEAWVPKSPDPELMNQAIEEVIDKVPEGVF
jgi:phosphoglucomutase